VRCKFKELFDKELKAGRLQLLAIGLGRDLEPFDSDDGAFVHARRHFMDCDAETLCAFIDGKACAKASRIVRRAGMKIVGRGHRGREHLGRDYQASAESDESPRFG